LSVTRTARNLRGVRVVEVRAGRRQGHGGTSEGRREATTSSADVTHPDRPAHGATSSDLPQ